MTLGARERGDGFISGNGWIVSWCMGHLVELAHANAYDEKYSRWHYEDLPIIPDEWKHVAASGKKKQLDILRRLMNGKDVETVICATDAGREGELIFRLVYEYCGCKKPVQRLWISSMEDTAIRQGFENLRSDMDYDNLYRAALCRSQADWLVGINMTRTFSCLYGVTLNVGRVQTPTLALVVRRDQEAAAFVREPFYIVEIACGAFTAAGEKLKSRQAADVILSACAGKPAAVQTVDRKEKATAPPRLYDLTTLQREANRIFGYTAQQTLDYTQALYEKKLVTYPRTDSRYLTSDMAAGLSGLVSSVAAALPFAKALVLSVNTVQVVDDGKVSDHHAIIPTAGIPKADLSVLPSGEQNILQMLAVRLLCAVESKHTYAETAVTVDCEGYSFKAKGRITLQNGWKTVEQAFKAALRGKSREEEGGAALPEVTEGQIFPSVSADLREGFTSPPKAYTEDTLLKAMETAGAEDMPEDAERKGLGTPATRAGIIEKLVKSGLMERRKKNLLPTEKGTNLIAVLPDPVKSPQLTAEWENRLKQVEHGSLGHTTFMDGIAAMTRELVKTHSAPDEKHRMRFTKAPDENAVGICPRCGGSVRENKKGFCCGNRSCGFALWKNSRFFTAKHKELNRKTAAALLSKGRVFLSGLYSERTGKTYDAAVVLDDTGKYVNFKLQFEKGTKK